jgi:hypothetical protein
MRKIAVFAATFATAFAIFVPIAGVVLLQAAQIVA